MEKEDILAISRRENKNSDLAGAEMSAPAASEPARAASFRFYLFGLLTRCFSAHGSSTSAFLVRIIW